MRLRDWAESVNISYRTARRWVAANKMPVPFTKTATGIIFVHVEETVESLLRKEVLDLKATIVKLREHA